MKTNHEPGYELSKRISEARMQGPRLAWKRYMNHLAKCSLRRAANSVHRKLLVPMTKWRLVGIAGLALLLANCATINIPPDKEVWAQSVRQQIAEATEVHYVYIPLTDNEELKIVEYLAFKQGKSTQRIKKGGKITACVFQN